MTIARFGDATTAKGNFFDHLVGEREHLRVVAAITNFFASDDACYITGETLHVTGGLH